MRIRGRTTLVIATTLIGLGSGVGAFVVPRWFDSAGASVPYRVDSHRSVATLPNGVGGVNPRAGDFAPDVVRPVAAATPEAAIAYFLDARQRGNLDDAWRVVSDRDRRQFPAAVDYEDANGELPRVVHYSLGAPSTSGFRAHVPGTVSFVASLDQIGGNVPAHATASWTAVRERSTWHVLLSESEIHPQFPAAAGARPAALAWAAARQRCTTGPQWHGPLLGSDAETRAAQLCHTAGTVRVGAPRELDANDGSDSFLAAFGGDVFTWARVVPLTSPVSLDIVLAPIGDQWSVIGAIQASPASSG